MKTKRMLFGCLTLGLLLIFFSSAFAAAPGNFGKLLGSPNGVAAYSNGSTTYISNLSNYYNSKYMGMKWQCVEFTRRYTYIKRGYLIPSNSYTKTATTVWNNASALGLSKANNGSTNRPRVNDLVFSTPNTTGHVGVIVSAPSSISSTGTYSVTVAHQNWSTTTPTIKLTLTVKKNSSGAFVYKLSNFSSTYTVKGWAWR